jgi:serine/threonine-protein kinase
MPQLPSLGRYEPLFRVASGGMAEVFAARIRGEAGFQRLVAVKRMLPHLAADEHFVQMFLDEAKLAVHVASPHVVQTLDLGRAADGALFIAMELVVGCSLAAILRELRVGGRRVPPRIALEILAQAAQGLDAAHEAVTPTGEALDIVHRDVSPQNILIGVDGRTRVADFGVARAMMRRSSTATGELKGKIAYFSPEQASGQPIDRRADVFALGCVAFEVLAGRRLFSGADALQILAQVKEGPIPPLHELDEAIPYAASAAVARALARPLDARWPTAGAFAVALRGAAEELGPRASSREIAAWVGEAGGEPLAHMRAQVERALTTGEGADRALPGEPPSASKQGVASHSETVAVVGVSSEPRARESAPGQTRGARPGRVIAGVVGVVVVAGGLGWGVHAWRATAVEPAAANGGTTAPAAPARSGDVGERVVNAASASASTSATFVVAAASVASTASTASTAQRPTLIAPRGVGPAAPGVVAPKLASSGVTTPTVTATAPVASPTKAAPKGAILGDDAFNRDLGKMTK